MAIFDLPCQQAAEREACAHISASLAPFDNLVLHVFFISQFRVTSFSMCICGLLQQQYCFPRSQFL
uniref:Uncharacterized protein n=1 Tax=Arundo donax TaxID=35708 RepID=A0A0A9G3H0_ARUDO